MKAAKRYMSVLRPLWAATRARLTAGGLFFHQRILLSFSWAGKMYAQFGPTHEVSRVALARYSYLIDLRRTSRVGPRLQEKVA